MGFKHIAELVRKRRYQLDITQTQLAKELGFKNSQSIVNIERGICSVPIKRIIQYSKVLSLSENKIKDAIVRDFEERVVEEMEKQSE